MLPANQMARKLGGEISHILLWPFGGICFSSRDRRIEDPRTLIKNDLLIVGAGPTTHFFQVPELSILSLIHTLPACVRWHALTALHEVNATTTSTDGILGPRPRRHLDGPWGPEALRTRLLHPLAPFLCPHASGPTHTVTPSARRASSRWALQWWFELFLMSVSRCCGADSSALSRHT